MAVSDYSTTAASNTSISGIDISGATGKVKDGDNAIRQIMADIKAGVPYLTRTTLGLPSGTTAVSYSGATVTYTTTSAGTLLTLESSEAGATAGPVLTLYRNSATPAASDILGQLLFNGEDSAGNTQEYASIEAVIADATSTSEDSSLDFYAPVAGSRTKIASLGPGITGNVIASQAEQETATAVNKIVTPGRQHYHPSAAKAWAQFNPAAGVAASYNITSVTDNGTGYWTVNIATDFSSGNYSGGAFGGQKSGGSIQLVYNTNSFVAGTFNIFSSEANTAATGADPGNPDAIFFWAFGDQS